MRKKLKILITMGPTVEPIDPVRFISNRSTGRMGRELARAAKKRKHAVTVITGPAQIPPPKGVKAIKIETARELQKKVRERLKNTDALIMASAVCDFKPDRFSGGKLKSAKTLSLALVKNPDILESIPQNLRRGKVIAGFALESRDLLKNAGRKLRKKKLDLIVANATNRKNRPFGSGRTTVFIIDREKTIKKLKNSTKKRIASAILDRVEELCYTRR